MRKIINLPYGNSGRDEHERIFGKKDRVNCTHESTYSRQYTANYSNRQFTVGVLETVCKTCGKLVKTIEKNLETPEAIDLFLSS